MEKLHRALQPRGEFPLDESAMSKLYFFSNRQYVRYDINRDAVDSHYPLPVGGYWTGLPAPGVDAAINWGNGYAYFFAANQYYRFNTKLDQVESGYPLPIAGNWPGLTLDAVDACVNWGNGKAYFFRGGQYWRYDIKKDSVDPGFPLPITGNWPGLTLDAVDGCINWGNGKAYLFRGAQYWRYDIKKDAVDPGFPLPIARNWPGLFTSGVRAPVVLGYAGCDLAGYPGDAAMTALWSNTNLKWCGFYLTPAPNQGAKLGWMGKRAFLTGLGFGLAPIYVGEQQIKVCPTCSAKPSTQKGTTDAADAIALATSAGFPSGSVIYLDIETGDKVNDPMRDYYKSWVAGIISGGFVPGVYCSFMIARQLKSFDSRPVFWVFNISKYAGGAKASYQTPLPAPEPLLSSIEFSTNWQLAQAVGSVKMPGQTVANIDLDSASVPNPSSID